MLPDPVATAGLVTREVRTSAREGVPTKVAVARRTYAADQADLWDALTDPERLPRWFLPVSGDLAPGGRYQLEGNAGGTIEVCDAPTSLAVTWEYGDVVSWLRVRLEAAGEGQTTLELQHESPVDPAMWGQFGPGAVGVGWDLALMGLGLHLDSGAPVDADAALAFPLSDAGKRFVQTAADGWADAAIADGDDEAAARRAADATLAFYTEDPEEGGPA